MEVDVPGCYNVNDGTHNFFAPILFEREEGELWAFHKENRLGVGNESEIEENISFLPLEYLINYFVREDGVGFSEFIFRFVTKNYNVDPSFLSSALERGNKFYYRYAGEGSIITSGGPSSMYEEPIIPIIPPFFDEPTGVSPVKKEILTNTALSIGSSGAVSSPYSSKEFLYFFGCVPFIYVSYIPPFVIPNWFMFGFTLTGLLASMVYNTIRSDTYNRDPRGLTVNGHRTEINNSSDNISANLSDFSAQSLWVSLGVFLFGSLVTHISRRNGFNFALRFIPPEGNYEDAPAQIIEKDYPERFRRVDLNYYLIYDRKSNKTYFGRMIVDFQKLDKEEKLLLSGKKKYPQDELESPTKENALVVVSNDKKEVLKTMESKPLSLPVFSTSDYEVLGEFLNEIPIGIAVEEKRELSDYSLEPYLVMVATVEKPSELDFTQPFYTRTIYSLLRSSPDYVSKSTLYRHLRSKGGNYIVRIYLVNPSENRISLVYETSGIYNANIFPKMLASCTKTSYRFKLLFGDRIITVDSSSEKEESLTEVLSFTDAFSGLDFALEKAEFFFG